MRPMPREDPVMRTFLLATLNRDVAMVCVETSRKKERGGGDGGRKEW